MREILFRGKQKHNGEWAYGHLVKDATGYCAIFLDGFIAAPEVVHALCFEVIPETVGQYTGRHDLKGEKLFEGDVCAYSRYANWENALGEGKSSRMIGEIVFGKEGDFSEVGGHYHCCAFYLRLIDDSGFYQSLNYRAENIFLSETNPTWGLEKIGTRYDNPELLTPQIKNTYYK